MSTDVKQTDAWRVLFIVMACILVLHSPLIINPGYLSHDELQWAYFAVQHKGPAFINNLWGDVYAFQYRPITFSLWMLISRRCFDHPYLFHAIIVMISALNAGMLSVALLRTGIRTRAAIAGGLLFGLGPYAAYTHGWVATLADLMWVFCALAIALVTMLCKRHWSIRVVAFTLTTAALLSKESAIVLPALFALAWLFSRRKRSWLEATVFATMPVAVYLWIRLHTLLTEAPADSPYAWHISTIPLNWIKYQLYPLIIKKFGAAEVHTSSYLVVIWCLLMWALWKAHIRYLLAFLLFGTASLGPVLIVQPASWYGYGFSAVVAAVLVLAWPHMKRGGHLIVSLCVLLGLLHSVYLVYIIHAAGEKQSHFSPALAEAMKSNDGKPIRLSVENEKDRWIYVRMTHDIPAYNGVNIGNLVTLTEGNAPSDYQVQQDGSLKRLP